MTILGERAELSTSLHLSFNHYYFGLGQHSSAGIFLGSAISVHKESSLISVTLSHDCHTRSF